MNVASKPIVNPVRKKTFAMDVLLIPKVLKIAISFVLFLTKIVNPEIILKAATIIINVKIINITFLSTFNAPKKDLFKSAQEYTYWSKKISCIFSFKNWAWSGLFKNIKRSKKKLYKVAYNPREVFQKASQSGKSTATSILFDFKNKGEIILSCYDMDKATNQIDSPIKDINQFDSFRIDIRSEVFKNYLEKV